MIRLKQRNSFDELEKFAKPLSSEEMKRYVGGGKYGSCTDLMDMSTCFIGADCSGESNGSFNFPYSMDEVVVIGHKGTNGSIHSIKGDGGINVAHSNPYNAGSFNMNDMGGGFTSPVSAPDTPRHDNLHDGINLTNNKYIALNLKGYNALSDQIKKLFESNATLKKIALRFDKGQGKLIIGTVKNQEVTPFGYADPDGEHIFLNTQDIDTNGWNNPEGDYIDNAGIAIGADYTQEEKLLVTLAHEIIHASHFSIYNEAMQLNKSNSDYAASWLMQQGHSEDFVDVFFHKENGRWEINSDKVRNDNMHEYMKRHDAETINSAVNEYREDFNLIKHD